MSTLNELLFGKRLNDGKNMEYLVMNNHFECSICEKKNEMYFTKSDIQCKSCYIYLNDKSKHCLHGKNKLMCFDCSGPKE